MTINLELSVAGVEKAIAELDAYGKSLKDKIYKLIDMMVENGEKYAIFYISNHIDTGETLSTIKGYRKRNKGVVVAGGAAIWLEFGTGVIKNNSAYPHPKARELGMNSIGGYGDGNGSNPSGWWYRDDTGTCYHTTGVEATMFMYNSLQALYEKTPEFAKEVFET